MGLCGSSTRKQGFASKYLIGEKLGSGSYATVHRCQRRSDGATLAVKIVKKLNLDEDELGALQQEIDILSRIKHDNILRFEEVIEDAEAYYIITELIEGGELFDQIVNQDTYSEREARHVTKTLLEALAHLHAKNIVHRDLKPENILLTQKSMSATIKLADFGFAKDTSTGPCHTKCGTPGYVAPEILTTKPAYTTTVDVWAVGVITYILLCGRPPFYSDKQSEMYRAIRRGEYSFFSPDWDVISSEAKSFISALLTVDPQSRPTAAQALQHQWIVGEVKTENLAKTLTELKKFNARRRWKAGINAVRAGVRIGMMRNLLSEKSITSSETKEPESAEPEHPAT